jgi:subfamily B ATP-binding cassette protein MsbA
MGTLNRFVTCLRPYLLFLGLALLGALGETAADLLQPWPLKVLFDNIIVGKPLSPAVGGWVTAIFGAGVGGVLVFALSSVLAIAMLNGASTFMQDFFMPRVGHWVLHDLRRQLYWHIQRLELAYHDERRVGDLFSTFTSDIQAVRELIESALIGLIVNSLTLTGMIVIMLLIDWRFALLALSITPFLFVVVYRFTRRIKAASRDARRGEGAVASVAQEVLSSIRLVQAFTREDHEQARFERENQKRIQAGIRQRTLQAQLKPLIELLVAAGTVLVLWYGTHQVLVGGLMPGSLLVVVAYISRLYKPMKELSKQIDILSRAAVGLERVTEVLDTERRVQDVPGARPAPDFRGRIQFEDVSFSYRAGVPVLKNIAFTVEPGQMVALVGPTGAGKTSLLRLIPRFDDPDHGCVRVDDRDIRSYTLASLRGQVSLVLQETTLFYGTVRENIAYGRPEASFDEIVAAAKTANAHTFIERLPLGYDTPIGERGMTLSGGQRQLIAIARAAVRDAPILLFDEPTTGLDSTSEALVMEGLARLLRGRTAIVIAHRLTTISRADTILVLGRGEIVERGTHQALLAAGGRYAELYELQFGGGKTPVGLPGGLSHPPAE